MEPPASPGTTDNPSDAEMSARGLRLAAPSTEAAGPPPTGTTPPGVLNLNAYLVYATGKAARRRLTEALAPHGLRLWHLTVLTMLADVGPRSKGDLASRLDMNQSDLARTVQDLDKAGHVACTRDPADRRRIEVALTPAGRSVLSRLNDDVASIDEDLLAPLDEAERAQFAALLRRVHGRLGPAGDDTPGS